MGLTLMDVSYFKLSSRPYRAASTGHVNPGLRCACPGLFHFAPLGH